MWRRERDSNPRRGISPYSLSRGALSTTQPSLRMFNFLSKPSTESGMDSSLRSSPLRGAPRASVGAAHLGSNPRRGISPYSLEPRERFDHSAISPHSRTRCPAGLRGPQILLIGNREVKPSGSIRSSRPLSPLPRPFRSEFARRSLHDAQRRPSGR